MADLTKFKIYSLGIVTVNKDRDSAIITVLPIEYLSMVNGDINSIKQDQKVDAVISGEKISNEVSKTAVITAKWLPYGISNRATPPDVIKGETVLLFTYGDTGEYWWTTVFNEPSIRRLERVVHVYGDIDVDDKLPVIGKDNSHYVDINAYDKYIELQTSDNRGEKTTYKIKLDLKEGIFTLEDKQENLIELNSVEGVLTATINTKVHVTTPTVVIDCTDTTVNASNDITLNVGNNLTATVDGDTTIASGGDISGSAGGDVNISAGGNVDVTAGGSLTATASDATVTASTITLNGNVSINGNLVVSGGLAGGGGSAPPAGEATFGGDVSTSGDVKAGSISLKNHTHQGVHGQTGPAQ